MGISIPMSPISSKDKFELTYDSINVPIDVFYTLGKFIKKKKKKIR